MTKEYIINYLKEHKNEFSQKFGITKLGLFGSYVKDEASENSDIDILIELENNLSDIYEKKSKFKNILESHFNLNVDIAREKYLKPMAKEEILKEVVYV
ncbi:nucleotidyltransferase domain-containing protein [Halarcobacter sp.]|uniref:nucleotidyltransferase family protein n=1 Tax=Halarcobacter sp. TaxID=2321133 RepID=UPI0029F52660|nr:nucleotidyltransferase domain-containing protein [Halarcobacter sp.]